MSADAVEFPEWYAAEIRMLDVEDLGNRKQ